MSNATASRLGQVNAAGDVNSLFLKVFSGEVLSAFERENLMLNMTNVRSITSGKSAQFPITGTISSSYHTIGNEILGTAVNKNEKVINIDDMLLANAFVAELDELKNHYDVRSIYSKEMGQALAKTIDKNILNLVVLASRASTANVTGGNLGSVITDADADTSASSLKDSIFDAIQKLDENDVPSSDRFIVVKPDQYYQLLNLDSVMSRDFSDVVLNSFIRNHFILFERSSIELIIFKLYSIIPFLSPGNNLIQETNINFTCSHREETNLSIPIFATILGHKFCSRHIKSKVFGKFLIYMRF